jgi:hypothetical protein
MGENETGDNTPPPPHPYKRRKASLIKRTRQVSGSISRERWGIFLSIYGVLSDGNAVD